MHETHLIKPVIESVLTHADAEGAKSISEIHLKVGQFTGIKEESFRETFTMLAQGTMLENAKLKISFFPAERVEVVSFEIEE